MTILLFSHTGLNSEIQQNNGNADNIESGTIIISVESGEVI